MKVQSSLLWPCILALSLSHISNAAHNPRQILSPSATTTQPPPTNTPQPPSSTGPAAPTTPNPPPTTPSTPTNTSPTTPTQGLPNTTSALPPSDTQTTSAPSTPTVAPLPITSEAFTTTNEAGDAITVTVVSSLDVSSTTPLPTNTAAREDDDGGGGLSTGSIVGMSVAAGVAVIGIVGFFVWKFTRKRFSDFDDNEAIKWPELNTHSGGPDSHPIPGRDTGRAGFDTGSEANLSRVNSISNYSTPDFGAGGPDQYAVPPLPHLNPNQPYRDDPSAPSGYYDPYRGPVPGTLENGGSEWQPEAYPMTQLGGPTGRASPAMFEGGRQSPAPHGMYAGRGSPAPQVAYGGRASPGPQAAYSTGRMSPGPNAAYDVHGGRL